MSNAKAIDVMRIALQQYAYKESPPGSNKTKFGKAFGMNGVPWCAEFVWWGGYEAKGDNPIYKSANAADIEDMTVKNKGGKYILKQTSNNSNKLKALPNYKFGDIISFNFNGGASRSHVGYVVGVSGNSIYCLEGNTSFSDAGSQSNGGCVALRKRNYTYGVCVVRPKYASASAYKPTKAYGGTVPKLPSKGCFEYGDKSSQVKNLQKALSWANGYELKADGQLGAKTFAEIVIFQVINGCVPDGQFGKSSLKKLQSIINSKKTPQKDTQDAQKDEKPKADQDVKGHKKVAKISDKVLDISAWQGKVSEADWKKVIKDGITCVILRSSYTKQDAFKMYKDSVFDHNIKAAISAGMHIGIYHYSQAITESEAKKEAEFCLSCIKPYKADIDLPVAFDWEFGGRLSASAAKKNGKTKNTAICDAFCDRAKKDKYDTMVYANLSTINNYLTTGIYKTHKIWIAQYNSSCDYKYKYYLWQYTSSGSVNGISGKLDVSRFYKAPTKTEDDGITFPSRGYFKKGDKGAEVKEVQKLLNKAVKGAYGYTLKADGDYGDKTVRTCKFLQEVRHITIDGNFGKATLKQCEKKVTSQMMAVNWAVSIADDNSFAYGVGERAHHNGCYFCGTNITGKKKAKKGDRWEKTYCCNPFVHAAYAHGAGDEKMLKACKANSVAGLTPESWEKFGFKLIGKCKNVKYSDLKVGDVIIKLNHHAWLYAGDGYLVEAGGEGWGADSIVHKKSAKSRYSEYAKRNDTYVLRYKG